MGAARPATADPAARLAAFVANHIRFHVDAPAFDACLQHGVAQPVA